MVSKCANPACSAPFRYLHEGKLFRIERELQRDCDQDARAPALNTKRSALHVEFFWLCNDCAKKMTIVFEKNIGISTRPLRRTLRAAS